MIKLNSKFQIPPNIMAGAVTSGCCSSGHRWLDSHSKTVAATLHKIEYQLLGCSDSRGKNRSLAGDVVGSRGDAQNYWLWWKQPANWEPTHTHTHNQE